MKKCLYTESDITQTGAQLILCSVSLDGSIGNVAEQKFKRAFPDAYSSLLSMLRADVDEKFKANLGDVVWVTTSGNRHIGFGIVRKTCREPINTKALKLVINSTRNKAIALKKEYVGMDLFACDTPHEWAAIVGIIEAELKDIQAVVCIPTNDALVKVLEALPGEKNFRAIKG